MTDPGQVGAAATVDDAAQLLGQLVATASPTGHERPLAELVVDRLRQRDVAAEVQEVDGELANVVVGARPDGRPRLLLYGQLDTTFRGTAETDTALIGTLRDPEFTAAPVRHGDWLLGLGAENPKGYLTAGLLALETLAAAGLPEHVQLVAGLCGGGMPALPLGYGHGCRALLAAVAPVEAAIVPKPGFAVSWEEVGVAVYRVTIEGRLGYTGIRAFAADENTVAAAAHVVLALEDWFAGYAERHASAFTRPRGAVVAVQGGDPNRPAFWPQTCELHVDLRLPPGTPPADLDAELRGEIARLAAAHRVGARVDCLLSDAGTVTSPDTAVVRAAVTAWQELTGQPHEPRTATSGWTDATTLRNAGVDTARIGMPRPPTRTDGPPFSMGAVHLPSLLVLVDWLIRTVLAFDELHACDPDRRQPSEGPRP